jgi:hypothetical protein
VSIRLVTGSLPAFDSPPLSAGILTDFTRLVIDLVRTGSFISWVAIELGVFGVLWVLWLCKSNEEALRHCIEWFYLPASAALSTSTLLFTGDCGFWDRKYHVL